MPQFPQPRASPFAASTAFEPGNTVKSKNRRRLSVVPPGQVVELRTEFDSRHVLKPQYRAVRIRPQDDVPELFRGNQPSLRFTVYVNFCPSGTGSPPI